MGELYELYPKLPKNIRQIGERDTVLRLYVEDYVKYIFKTVKAYGGPEPEGRTAPWQPGDP